jgi:hypothetical protein
MTCTSVLSTDRVFPPPARRYDWVMEGYAANSVTHAVSKQDVTGKGCSVMMRGCQPDAIAAAKTLKAAAAAAAAAAAVAAAAAAAAAASLTHAAGLIIVGGGGGGGGEEGEGVEEESPPPARVTRGRCRPS